MSGTELPETTRLRKRIELLESAMLEAAKRHDALCEQVVAVQQEQARRKGGRPRKDKP